MKGVPTGTKHSLLNFTGAIYPLPPFPYGVKKGNGETDRTKFRPIASCSVFNIKRSKTQWLFLHLLMLTLRASSAKPKWCTNWWKSYFQPGNCSNLLSNLPTAPICELQVFGQFFPKKNLIGNLKLETVSVEGLSRGIEKIQSNHTGSMASLIK